MVGVTGIEPVTPSMSTKCSPAELYAREAAARGAPVPSASAIVRRATGVQDVSPIVRGRPMIGAKQPGFDMGEAVYSLTMPEALRSCAVFSSPHSGAVYPRAFLDAIDLGPLQVRSSEDAFVDELFAAAPACGAPLLAARVPRACIDLNRARRRPRPGADRRRLAAVPQRPHRRRPRGHPARRRRGAADHAGQADARRGAAPDRRLLAPLSRPAAGAARRGARPRSARRCCSTATRCRTTR